ncbi:MAG: aspartate carbamoyltransferase regulatory subunit, partial [Fervidicoccaceae archaeon]
MSEDRLTVSKIKSGTVIDHIPAGQALNVLRILGITGQEGLRTAVLMNVESRKLGKKDIV